MIWMCNNILHLSITLSKMCCWHKSKYKMPKSATKLFEKVMCVFWSRIIWKYYWKWLLGSWPEVRKNGFIHCLWIIREKGIMMIAYSVPWTSRMPDYLSKYRLFHQLNCTSTTDYSLLLTTVLSTKKTIMPNSITGHIEYLLGTDIYLHWISIKDRLAI